MDDPTTQAVNRVGKRAEAFVYIANCSEYYD